MGRARCRHHCFSKFSTESSTCCGRLRTLSRTIARSSPLQRVKIASRSLKGPSVIVTFSPALK